MASRGQLEATRSAPSQAAATAPSLVSHARQLTCNGSSKIPKYLEGGSDRVLGSDRFELSAQLHGAGCQKTAHPLQC
ncbi:MAG: hypothetical protein CL931_09785 [Deltaproteobacteria bacterium]|nr:hypothetical protein [Deltaproteobacteria bacterium]